MAKTIKLKDAIALQKAGIKLTGADGQEWAPPDMCSLFMQLIEAIDRLAKKEQPAPQVNVQPPRVDVKQPDVKVYPAMNTKAPDVKVDVTAPTWRKIECTPIRARNGLIEKIIIERGE